VDEGKLLLFIKDEVASRVPRRGRRLNAEKERKSKGKGKRRAESLLQLSQPRKRQRGGLASATTSANTSTSALPVLEGEDDESCSDLVLMYNTVRGYCSAINELWAH
jgi:hypothetical protein